jgi:hypothetical protein
MITEEAYPSGGEKVRLHWDEEGGYDGEHGSYVDDEGTAWQQLILEEARCFICGAPLAEGWMADAGGWIRESCPRHIEIDDIGKTTGRPRKGAPGWNDVERGVWVDDVLGTGYNPGQHGRKSMAKKRNPDMYQVTVGNIGTVYDGDSLEEAEFAYKEYVEQSESGRGRAGNEEVTLWDGGEIMEYHIPEGGDEDFDDNPKDTWHGTKALTHAKEAGDAVRRGATKGFRDAEWGGFRRGRTPRYERRISLS